MRFGIHISLLTLLCATSLNVAADNAAASVDTSAWKCAYCEFDQGVTATVTGGFGVVSKDSFKFGEYSGLREQGIYVIGDAVADYRNVDNASYWDISALNLGLDTRSLDMAGGKQGLYRIFLSYDELPHYISDSARTPFRGNGGARLTLPADWVTAGSTADMSALNNDLKDVDLETKRTRLGLGVMVAPATQWETSLKFRQETSEGQRQIAGSFYFNAAELVMPVEYTTNLLDAAVNYHGKSWQAKLAYHGSTFNNQNNSLIWPNPYTPMVAGADQGELALPPDNQFHQLVAALTLGFGDSSKLMADVAFSRLTQDANFLSATRNANVSVAGLPDDSLQGRVDGTNANVKWRSELSDKFRINAAYQYYDRDNKTPRRSFDWVITDVNVAAPRTNLPYSYRRNTFKLNADYDIASSLKTAVGYDYEQYKRTYQEVEQSQERTVWASLVSRSLDNANITMKYAHAEREKHGYQVVAGIDVPENPLLRKYNMADRDRDTLGLRMDVAASAQSTFGLAVDVAKDDYPNSSIGLVSSQESHLGIDVTTQVTKRTSTSIFLSHENIDSDVAGSQMYNVADWNGSLDDSFDSAGIGLNHIVMRDKFDVGVDYVYTTSRGRITYAEGGADSQLPEASTRLNSAKLYGNYRLSQALVLNGSYWYERYTSTDWAFDGVSESTVSNNLGLGQEAPSYRENVFLLAVRYKL